MEHPLLSSSPLQSSQTMSSGSPPHGTHQGTRCRSEQYDAQLSARGGLFRRRRRPRDGASLIWLSEPRSSYATKLCFRPPFRLSLCFGCSTGQSCSTVRRDAYTRSSHLHSRCDVSYAPFSAGVSACGDDASAPGYALPHRVHRVR